MPTLTPVELATQRLLLRPMDERDTEAHYAVFSDPAVTRYWSTEPWTSIDQAVQAIARIRSAFADGSELRLGIVLRETGELIGNCALHHFVDASRRCEIGYALASAHWGKGYAGEALEALVEYGLRALDLNRIEADIDPDNVASGRVLEKLGFRKEGYMPERWIVHGKPADTVYYGLLRRYRDGG
ncbi:GNAT family N-acetyltransferase [uncultured Massilia sp.]|uniref:GNAT family N-acetyltransferase n=1 Tax=uncultured Massilia sp. TaxID=169973 RepID=UPI0025E4948E|nr:GNAT family N-acetyltransferase [uncultured Massilia sp.]